MIKGNNVLEKRFAMIDEESGLGYNIEHIICVNTWPLF